MVSASWVFAITLATYVSAQILSCTDDGDLPYTDDGAKNAVPAKPGSVEWWFFTAYSPASDAGVAITYLPNGRSSMLVAMLYLNASNPKAARVSVAAITPPQVWSWMSQTDEIRLNAGYKFQSELRIVNNVTTQCHALCRQQRGH